MEPLNAPKSNGLVHWCGLIYWCVPASPPLIPGTVSSSSDEDSMVVKRKFLSFQVVLSVTNELNKNEKNDGQLHISVYSDANRW